MEEKGGEAGDDQGSGWLQVKKKHRSNSKFSFQGWVGGLSRKQNSNIIVHDPCNVQHMTSNVSSSELISRNKDSPESDLDASNTTQVPTKDEKGVNYLDKRVVSHADDHKTSHDPELPQIDNLDVFPKIKWGNLDDGALVSTVGNTTGIDIKFGDIEVTEDDSASSLPLATEPVREIVPTIEEDTKSREFEEVKEVSSEEVKVVSQSDDVSQELDTGLKIENLESQGSETLKNPTFLKDTDTTTEIPKDSTPIENSDNKETTSILNDLSEVHIMSAIGPGEIEAGESKERFRQRLWCFLFENLNRAVDELYLLCELECDKDQMKEAVLVLEEAASDFKDLNSRVLEFEKVKKSSDNPPITMKSEQRRPHVLSWEVRRMTTSPHRAEILSSSLEAFKKIQQERASMNKDSNKTGFLDLNKRSTRTDRTSNAKEQVKRTGVAIKKNTDPGKNKKETTGSSETEKPGPRKDNLKSTDQPNKKPNFMSSKSMDAWKQKRNWEDILTSPYASTRFSHSPGMGRKSTERARILHDKLMSPDKKKKTSLDLKKEAEEKHARATRIRNELENERLQKLQKSTKKVEPRERMASGP